MDFIKALTPKNTEEVRTGLFVQARPKNPDTITYRQVHPSAWDGKIIWKNFLFGPNFFKGLVWVVILLFLVWAYTNDVKVYKDFYEKVISDPISYCNNVSFITPMWSEVNYEDTYIIQNSNG